MLRRSFSLVSNNCSSITQKSASLLFGLRCASASSVCFLQNQIRPCSTHTSSTKKSSGGGCPFSSSSQSTSSSEQQQQQENAAEPESFTSKACPFSGKSAAPAEACPLETPKKTDIWSVTNQLGKSKLSAFVTSTATAGYVLCGGTSVVSAVMVTLGTYLLSLSANTANQCIEIEHDRKMKRTMFRPLVTGVITRPAAMALCAAELAIGTAMLATSVPATFTVGGGAAAAAAAASSLSSMSFLGALPTFVAATPIGQAVALLGVVNWILYVCMYTPLKRVSATNTWFGAIVGAIPPLMGGVAALSVNPASAALATSVASLSATSLTAMLLAPQMAPAYLLAVIMFAWQIPHFMSLSFHCRRDYENAGYKMLAFEHPTRAAGYAVALSGVMAVFCVPCVHWFMPVEPWYYIVATVANGTMIFKSIRFFNDPKKYCRSCFVFSYIFLSLMLGMLCLNHMQPVARIQNLLVGSNHKNNNNKLEMNKEIPVDEVA